MKKMRQIKKIELASIISVAIVFFLMRFLGARSKGYKAPY